MWTEAVFLVLNEENAATKGLPVGTAWAAREELRERAQARYPAGKLEAGLYALCPHCGDAFSLSPSERRDPTHVHAAIAALKG